MQVQRLSITMPPSTLAHVEARQANPQDEQSTDRSATIAKSLDRYFYALNPGAARLALAVQRRRTGPPARRGERLPVLIAVCGGLHRARGGGRHRRWSRGEMERGRAGPDEETQGTVLPSRSSRSWTARNGGGTASGAASSPRPARC